MVAAFSTMAMMLALGNCQESVKPLVKVVKGKKLCDKGWSNYCCNQTISDYFQTDQFENLFALEGLMRLGSGITILSLQLLQNFIIISGGYGVATGGPLAWGLCYNKEMSPSKLYCDDYYKYTYPCIPGVSYHGLAYLLVFSPLEVDDTGEETPAFGNWKPTKNDTLGKRVGGFGTTMNVLYGDEVCGKGDSESPLLPRPCGSRPGPHDVLTCEEQQPFTVSPSSATSS
ncbi:hypothetical protein V6N11_064441 [Hibiscus sabdariffa]|uniref:Uncharacterized protein n=1 Tax=Hibiscus sabdariffa TaxID=183260 RepID=A0ABR2P8Y5_9ROSI